MEKVAGNSEERPPREAMLGMILADRAVESGQERFSQTELNDAQIVTGDIEIAGSHMDVQYDPGRSEFVFSMLGIERAVILKGSRSFEVDLLMNFTRKGVMFDAFERDINADLALGEASEIRKGLRRILEGTGVGIV
jgi:hypothetical protein